MRRRDFLPTLLAPALPAAAQTRNDWPQWRGPQRSGLSNETGLLQQWPENGPPMVWTAKELGEGYGSVSMLGDRLLVQGAKGAQSVVMCLNRGDGKQLWAATVGRKMDDDRGSGPRGTPTIDGDRVYVLGEAGDLVCLKLSDGSPVWKLSILSEFGGSNPNWLISESPLIDGSKLIVTPGGKGAGIVALDKMTGKTVWTSKELSDPAHYSSCIAADVAGVRAIMTITSGAAVGVRANDGKLLWRYQQVANRVANVTTPVVSGNKVFYSTAYGTGCALLELTPKNGALEAREVYFNRDMQNHHGGVVLVNGHLYGFSNAILTCMDFQTGAVKWRDRSVGKGSLTFADGRLYLLGEGNTVGLAEATPDAYREKGRFRIADQGLPSWAHPVVCGGRLYIRNQSTLTCYNIKA
ncbi:MAG: PQQ-binding-like beta-propeller repeat protein [Bryobacteraceae bacterium]|nr:PQQ-binding-like beta-propeller repeat protein [Bryobacteraceae bacterium]